MNALPVIPTPARLRVSAFLTEKFPFVIFACGVLAVAALWHRSTSPTLVAEAEAVSTEVRSAHSGTVLTLDVALLEPVSAGQRIARVQHTDPKVVAASLAVIRAEIELMRANLGPALRAQRTTLDAGRFQLDWMRERVTLASLRVQLQQADSEISRLGPLHAKKVISDEAYETAVHQRENVFAQIAEQTKLIETLEPAASEFSFRHVDAKPRSPAETLSAAIRVQEEKLRLTEAQLSPSVLTAPIDGIVALVHRRAGEAVNAGEPIVTVAATSSARLVGFLRQPLAYEPKRGAFVEVRTRTSARATASAQILEVGRVLEPVPATVLSLLGRSANPELGLRIHLANPATLHLRPGEQVDVTFRE